LPEKPLIVSAPASWASVQQTLGTEEVFVVEIQDTVLEFKHLDVDREESFADN
jgi:hypothetical protein